MTYDEWVRAARPHWQCQGCKGIFITVPVPDDYTCDMCKDSNSRLGDHVTFKVAVEEDFEEWLAGRKRLMNHCVCTRYPNSCRFHTDKTITEGPHNNLLPDGRRVSPEGLTCYYIHFYDGTKMKPAIGQKCLCGLHGYRGYTYSGEYVFRTGDDRERVRKERAEWSFGPRPSKSFICLLGDYEKASLYQALYDDGMRIDRAVWIIKEAK